MILHSVTHSRIAFAPVRGRIVELEYDTDVVYKTSEGVHRFKFRKGFIWDGRSGGALVDSLTGLPNHGTQAESARWLGHDGGGYPETISAKLGNELLRQAVLLPDVGYSKTLDEAERSTLFKGYSKAMAAAIHKTVSITSDEWKADDWSEVDPEWQRNKGLVKYRWTDK
jgi:hypothetical protein